MKELETALRKHQNKAWIFVLAVVGVLLMNLAAGPDDAPIQWEYKTIIFKVEIGDELIKYRKDFADALNRESRQGWQFVGPCAHLTGERYGIDYLVLRRPQPVY